MNRRERVEWIVTWFILVAIAIALPSPKRETIDGVEVVSFAIGNWEVQKWGQIAIALLAVGVIHLIVTQISRRIWPLPVEVEAEQVYHSSDGKMTIGWVPEEPGTRSPMEYTPWARTPDSTAEEFLTAEEPNPMRVLILGDAADQEHDDFMTAMHCWVEEASEATLRGLMPAAEELTQGGQARWVDEIVQRLVLAHDERGIPSREEIRALVERRKSEGIEFDFADWEDETPASGPDNFG